MTKTTALAPAMAPALPNAAIDMNQLLANEADGKQGMEMLDGAMLLAPVAEQDDEQADVPVDRAPQAGDEVTREDLGGGWIALHASWLAEPVKVQGEAAAASKLDEFAALIPDHTA